MRHAQYVVAVSLALAAATAGAQGVQFARISCPGCALVEGSLTLRAASGATALSILQGAKLSLDGTTGASTILADATRDGVVFQSGVASTVAGVGFQYDTATALATGQTHSSWLNHGSTILQIDKLGDVILNKGNLLGLDGTTLSTYVAADPTNDFIIVNGGQTNSASATAVVLASGGTYSTAGAKLVSIQNGVVEKASFDLNGALTLSGPSSSGNAVIVGTAGAKVCLNGSSCSTFVRDDGFGSLQLTGNAGILLNSNGSSTNVALDLHVDTNKNKSINITGDNTVDPTIAAMGTNVSISIIPTGTGSVKNNGDPIPAVHASQVATQQSIEFGGLTASSGSVSKTFATAFSSAPTCVCSDATATVSGCNVTAASATAATFKVTGVSDALNFYCIGAR